MEHQTVVAYGALFTDNDYGFDDLLLHEVAHEWWGNKITVSDWAHFWIQEGFATYAEALYVLDTLGEARYLDYMASRRKRISNLEPLIRGKNLTSSQAYTDDIYFKGAWVLHTLRWLLGDEDFFYVIWRFANDPDKAYGLVSSEDLASLVREISGREIGWFWERYLYVASEPVWRLTRRLAGDRERITITWDDPDFELPLPVWVAGEEQRIEMVGGRASFWVQRSTTVEVDPLGQVLANPAR
jgi:aminopeptidase N